MASIRRATPDDAELLGGWLRELLAHALETNDPYLQGIVLSPAAATARMAGLAADTTRCTLIASSLEQPAGFICGSIARPFAEGSPIGLIGSIDMLWVAPRFRRAGIGRELVACLEVWFCGGGAEFVDLHYLLGNPMAGAFWKKVGYAPYRVTSRRHIGASQSCG